MSSPRRKVYWAGRQWCVTDGGLDTISDDYQIDAVALGHLTDGAEEPLAERVRHVCKKTWVDIEDFFAAFAIALDVHAGKFTPLPAGALFRAMEVARIGRWADREFAQVRERRDRSGAPIGFTEANEIREMIDALLKRRLADGPSFQEVVDPRQPREIAPQ